MTAKTLLVRYGAISEVAKFVAETNDAPWQREQKVIVQTRRGIEMGTVLELLQTQKVSSTALNGTPPTNGTTATATIPAATETNDIEEVTVLRAATDTDQQQFQKLQQTTRDEFENWSKRIIEWKLELELIDLETLFDRQKTILYVLNDRGSDCTKLALFAAAAGLGTVEVQPVGIDGPLQMPAPTGGGG